MKFDKHGNGNGLDDLYVLPESGPEKEEIVGFLRSIGQHFHWTSSNTMGHDWERRVFIVVPFGESLRDDISKLTPHNFPF